MGAAVAAGYTTTQELAQRALAKARKSGDPTKMTEAEIRVENANFEARDYGLSEGQFGVGIIIFSLIMIIPAAAPGYIYIRYFCDSKNVERLLQLPIAHYCLIGFQILFIAQSFWYRNWWGITVNFFWLGVHYYFLTVAKRYVAWKTRYPIYTYPKH